MSKSKNNSNVFLSNQLLKQYTEDDSQLQNVPGSILLDFKEDLHNLGFSFQVLNQAEALMPKHKDTILPIVIKYYKAATIPSEKQYLLKWFHHRGLDEVIPMLIEDYYSPCSDTARWAIGDRLYEIRSKHYVKEYIKMITNPKFGIARQMVVLLLGKLKEESAIPTLIDLLKDEEVRLHVISALSEYKREEFRQYFEKFQDSTHPGWRKSARAALRRLGDKRRE